MQKEETKFHSSTVFEGMTSIRAVIKAIDENISDRQIKKIYYDAAKIAKISKEICYFKAVSSKYGFELVESNEKILDEMTTGNSYGGIISACSERTIPSLCDFDIDDGNFFVMLQGIEDPYNFGYALRSLYAMGIDGVILPERNWMSAAGVVARSSAGASELLKMYKSDADSAADYFKSRGFTVVCAEEKTDNLLGECELPFPIFLIIGGEKRGISKSVLNKADKLVKINYARDFRASLSAASAATMFGYEIMRQNSKK